MYSVDYEAQFKEESYNGETSDEINVQQDAEAKEDGRAIKSGSSYRFLFPSIDFCGTSARVHVENAP